MIHIVYNTSSHSFDSINLNFVGVYFFFFLFHMYVCVRYGVLLQEWKHLPQFMCK